MVVDLDHPINKNLAAFWPMNEGAGYTLADWSSRKRDILISEPNNGVWNGSSKGFSFHRNPAHGLVARSYFYFDV